ncbi:MAG: hypothetical protein Q8916_03760 [Bacteroidota bacterium]|nr:hypothetical protein [Bacteroidota bacterium]MDP4236912.1 hypothetical protein [Bacteroidota bacterium]
MKRISLPIVLLGLILIGSAVSAYAADSSLVTIGARLNSLDTSVAALRQKIQVQDLYISLVERTNQQLSHGMTFAAAFIAALGALFTIGSIIAGVMLFRQSRDFQRRINDAIEDYRQIVDGFIEEKKVELAMKVRELESRVAPDAESQRNIDREVKDLSALQDSLTAISKKNR